MTIFLTSEELADLTGYVQSAAQVRWLRRNRVHHFIRADGRPRVPRESIVGRVSHVERDEEPDFSALEARQ